MSELTQHECEELLSKFTKIKESDVATIIALLKALEIISHDAFMAEEDNGL